MSEQLLLGLGAVIIIIAGIFAFKAFSKNVEAKEEAKEFLAGLEEQLLKIFNDIIAEIDVSSFSTLDEYEEFALNKIYNGAWAFINEQLKKSENKEILSTLAQKFLTKENVDKFIREYLDRTNTRNNIENVYGSTVIEEKYTEMLSEDKDLEQQYSNQEEYNEEVDKENYNYAAPEEEQHTQEEIAALNPQQDIDEEQYSDDDTSVEDVTEYIEETKNRAGQTIYYLINRFGKKQRISKQNAINSGLEIRKILDTVS